MEDQAADKPTVRLEPEVVAESAAPVETPPASEEVWSKFSPEVTMENKSKPGKGLLIIVIILVAITVALLGLVGKKLLSGPDDSGPKTVVPTQSPVASPTVATTPTPMPTPEITAKNKVKIQVLNGSGVAGQAGKIATLLEQNDFVNPAAANAETSDQVGTVITYSPKVDVEIVNSIATLLKDTFDSVTIKPDSTLTTYDIVVTTGTDPEE